MKTDLKPSLKLDLRGLNAGDAARNFARDFVGLVNRNRKTAAVVVIVLLLAGCMSFVADAGMRDAAKEKQVAQEKQLQDSLKEAQQKRVEDAQRQKIEVDAKRKGELQNELLRFSTAVGYDMSRLNATAREYGGDKLNDHNAARKIETAKKLVLLINEYKSHLDGFQQFIRENFAELKKLGIVKQGLSEEEALRESEETKAFLKKLLTEGETELKEFVGSNAARLKIAGEVLQLLSDSLKNFEGEAK